MEEKIENNNNSIANYSKDNLYNKINSSSTISNKYYSNKKNPREMTVEELEEYIQKNRDKMNKYKNIESHSLNKSFTSHYNFGMPEKIDKIDKEVQNTFSVKKDISTKHFIPQEKKENLKLNINNSMSNKDENNLSSISSIIKGVVSNTPFVNKNNQSSRANTINNENDNTNFNISKNSYENSTNKNENKIYSNTLQLNTNIPSPYN